MTNVQVPPAVSHSFNNEACQFAIFDAHDVWHLLSAITLALWVQMLIDAKLRIAGRALAADR